METGPFLVIHVVVVDDAEADFSALGKISGLVEDKSSIPHMRLELLHRGEVYSVAGRSSKWGLVVPDFSGGPTPFTLYALDTVALGTDQHTSAITFTAALALHRKQSTTLTCTFTP